MRVALIALIVGSLSCAEAPGTREIVLHITTNAPVSGSARLFHRVQVSVVPPNETAPCVGCSRSFDIARSEETISVVPERTMEGYRVDVTLYRAQSDDVPRPESSITRRVGLPPLPSGTTSHVVVSLDIANVGKSLDYTPRADETLESWRDAAQVPCEAEVGADEACVPGGPFWMGSPDTELGDSPDADGRHERIVLLSPFVLDTHEVTVREFIAAGGLVRERSLLRCGTAIESPQPSDNPLPVVCVTWREAKTHCERRGGRLPTEAELEYAMGALRSQPYPWPEATISCADANYGRGIGGGTCGSYGAAVMRGGTFPRDSLVLGTRTVVDLAGNVSEFASDQYELSGGDCWPAGILRNPNCQTSSALPGQRSVRGGSSASPASRVRSTFRSSVGDEEKVSRLVGFRCARSIP